MSLPAQNTPPDPMSRWAPTSVDASPRRDASVIAAYMAEVSAFFFSARAKRIVCTPSWMVISISAVMVFERGEPGAPGSGRCHSIIPTGKNIGACRRQDRNR